MDQPTNIEMTIKGKEMDVKRAAISAMRRIDLNSRGFDENKYLFGDGINFNERMDAIMDMVGEYSVCPIDDNKIEFRSEQESYSCAFEADIKGIAEDMLKVTSDIEFHIGAAITITASDGYDTCVDIDYANGELRMDVEEVYYNDDDDLEWQEE